MSYLIEEEHGSCTGSLHPRNGYYAGDFSHAPMPSIEQLATLVRMCRPQPPRRCS